MGDPSGSSRPQNYTLRNDGVIPQLFTSVPTLNDAATYLSQTASLFTRCFTDDSELVTFWSRPTWASLATSSDDMSSSGNHSSTTESSSTATDSPSVVDGTARGSAGDSSRNSSALIKATNGGQNDIGWLQRDPTMPPVEDGTERFMEILGDIRHGVHRLPNSMVCLLVPGLFSTHGPLYFVNTKMSLSKLGLLCHIAKIHSEELYWGSEKRALLRGHSKGGIDAAAALSLYWPDLKDKVAGLALAQSPYGGSPIATDILQEGQLGDYVNLRKLMEIVICKVIKGDLHALEDLTYEKRREFLRKHPLPKELPVVSFHTEAAISPAVLATLSRVAHAERPAALSADQAAKLPVVMPLGAAMAACAQLVQVRYGKKSDGLVTCCDAKVPGSIVVKPNCKLDHAWMVYSSLSDDPCEADASQGMVLSFVYICASLSE
ncbi:hypothetical protein D8674_020492 [Pyrus ussuriensis x Pyrus communis]|uniref:Uncharacterized protein n=1 Tax=Pyrus ussuriensis x Pyrus communis TaxID=2448454 RepID=A0A5N5HU13_9ROSA|nr:hypothetical protein D8674_020492 [Pyrus ussuriensis x Pyrus communis]